MRAKRLFYSILSIALIILVYFFLTLNIRDHFLQFTDSPISNLSNKYVRYKCHVYCGGFGDRLKGIFGAYIWAKLTNRKFQIDVRHPCLLQIILNPNEIDWVVDTNKTLNLTEFTFEAMDNQEIRDDMRTLNILKFKKEFDVINIRNNLDWILSFSKNKYLKKRINELGYSRDKFAMPYIFRDIYKKLFKLSPKLEPRYRKFIKEAKPTNDTKLICTQIREHYAKKENSKLFWQFVNKTFLQPNKKMKYKMFITTDMPDVEKEGVKFFGKKNTVTMNGDFFHMDRGDVTLNDCKRIEKVILDFHALENCDMVVISESGFGKLGVYNRVKPDENLYVFKNHNNEKTFAKVSMEQLAEFDYYF